MNNIVTRLRHLAWAADENEPYAIECAAAADEIERLLSLIAEYGRATYNRANSIGGGVETWNALTRASKAICNEAMVILASNPLETALP